MAKKALCLVFAFLLSINSLAAAVSDNDGSAFITKAEFDSLKNDFQSQIDQYNTSIDNKIDVAIASYLSGIKTEVISNFTPFVEVNDATPKIIGREYDYGNVTQRFYNEISVVASIFGCAGGAIVVNNPLTIGENELSTSWGFWVQPLSHLRAYGRGYEFDENGNVTSIYDNDNIVINMTLTDSCDPYSYGIDFGSWFGWTGFNNANPKTNGTINTQYIDYLPHGNERIYRLTSYGYYQLTQDWHDVLNDYDNFLFSNTELGSHWSARNTDAGRWTGLTNAVYFIHKQENREKDISVYNAVDATIYAYQKGTKNIESFADIIGGSLTDKQRRWQLFTYKGSDYDTMTAIVSGKKANEVYENMRPHRAVYCIGKFKMANITDNDNYKPLYKGSSSVPHNQWNNLYQFQNGYMSYTWKDNTYSPKFYGGVPLFTPDKDLSKVTFKIKAEATSPTASKIRLWFKEYEFPNDYVELSNPSWDTINPQSGNKYKNEMIIVTSNTKTTNTEKFIDIDPNTEVTITISKPKNGIPYFLKFAEYNSTGTMVGEGGKIVYLSEFQKSIET